MTSCSNPASGIKNRPTGELATETSGISSTGASITTLRNAATSHRRIASFVHNLGSGIILDVRARTPWYLSDWTDAWNYRVVPATALIFFANVLPGIAFSLDLIETTQQYGVAEVLISSFMAAFVFS
ncbi:hypothetical protein K503DRAFT_870882, partial [Rhizopogon vinicolor AM-OR11-026]